MLRWVDRNQLELSRAENLSRVFVDAMPGGIVHADANGDIQHINELGMRFLGLRYDEHGRMPRDLWMKRYEGRRVDGEEIPMPELPVMVALDQQRPAHSSHQVRFFGEQWFDLAVSA